MPCCRYVCYCCMICYVQSIEGVFFCIPTIACFHGIITLASFTVLVCTHVQFLTFAPLSVCVVHAARSLRSTRIVLCMLLLCHSSNLTPVAVADCLRCCTSILITITTVYRVSVLQHVLVGKHIITQPLHQHYHAFACCNRLQRATA
jgi:glucose-6-phosphate-specific signal transduction histidine kinase